jgi:hypothetical protein
VIFRKCRSVGIVCLRTTDHGVFVNELKISFWIYFVMWGPAGCFSSGVLKVEVDPQCLIICLTIIWELIIVQIWSKHVYFSTTFCPFQVESCFLSNYISDVSEIVTIAIFKLMQFLRDAYLYLSYKIKMGRNCSILILPVMDGGERDRRIELQQGYLFLEM